MSFSCEKYKFLYLNSTVKYKIQILDGWSSDGSTICEKEPAFLQDYKLNMSPQWCVQKSMIKMLQALETKPIGFQSL